MKNALHVSCNDLEHCKVILVVLSSVPLQWSEKNLFNVRVHEIVVENCICLLKQMLPKEIREITSLLIILCPKNNLH